MALTPAAIKIVKDTAPVVAQHVDAITSTFYKTMFQRNPEVLKFFNPSHQTSGEQPRALADAVVAYALNIDHLQHNPALSNIVELVAQKHVSMGIQPAQYDVVGENLMLAIGKVLGDAVTPEIADAWTRAYGTLAGIFIRREEQIYAAQKAVQGGWNLGRKFRVDKRVEENAHICSFYMKPEDGGALPTHEGGQYTAVYLKTLPNLGLIAPRNYSISSKPGSDHYRISVRRDESGVVSSHLHRSLLQGQAVEIAPPAGEFVLDKAAAKRRPMVFLAGGIGITPLLSMLHEAAVVGKDQHITWIHAVMSGEFDPTSLRQECRELLRQHGNANCLHAYTAPRPEDTGKFDIAGLLTAEKVLKACNNVTDADFYVCGPRSFMVALIPALKEAGVPAENLHFEFFGPKVRGI
eukprot:GILJ01009848.1.p1 GENE.GILJ01009848.1~~GILJ01009848.1.p1  ORF type:complete len:408 (+),score=56.13 GILJ01009848.1:80-1303(+)